MFENRYRHTGELIRMGAEIQVSGRVAVVTGTGKLSGAPVECTDLRGGAALCAAALAAEGETSVGKVRHIDRGYEDIVRDLQSLGAEAFRGEQTTGASYDETQKIQSEAPEGKIHLPL